MAALKALGFLLLVCLTSVSCRQFTERTAEGKQWALLVAGSNSWYNYRHQADICHAYQILHKHGIPDENIVVMMYDDIADNERNKYPGKIFNRPGGPDVYEGVLKDYTGEDVTPKNFINILTGNKRAMSGIGSGKVIESGPNDHVFVFFADHGAPGLVAFPSAMLHARTLNDAIQQMHEENKYQKMVFYIEACESGSMFNKLLPVGIEVYATTASDPRHSSYACYYDKELGTYLGDVYSVKWMENDDKVDLQKETLIEQYNIIKMEVNTSHVQKYGDMSFDNLPLSEFMGSKEVEPEVFQTSTEDAVPAPDVPLISVEKQLLAAETDEERRKLSDQLRRMIEMREHVSRVVDQIAEDATQNEEQKQHVLTKPAEPEDWNCYEEVAERFSTTCFNLGQHDYALRHVFVLSNLCEEKIPVEKIIDAIDNNCEVGEPDGEALRIQ